MTSTTPLVVSQGMRLLPSSPRRRRRVIAGGSVTGVAAIVTVVFLALPSTTPPNPTPTGTEGAAQLVAKTSRHVSAADRKLINDTFDHFVPAGVARRSADVAWAWAGPELRAGSTLAEWRNGTTPVPSYPAAGTSFHGWGVLDATPTTVDYNLLVHPRKGAGTSAWVFQGELVKMHDRWLVNTIYTTAIMAKPDNGPKEVGPADFAAPAARQDTPTGVHGALSRTWLSTLIGVLLGVVVLVPLGIGLGVYIRRRRWQKKVRAGGATELPSLPPSVRNEERDEAHVA